jgi:hypothetical protein
MSPTPSSGNVPNLASFKIEHDDQFLSGKVSGVETLSQFTNRRLVGLAASISLPFEAYESPALSNRISHVVACRSWPQMGGVTAPFISNAGVKDERCFGWNRALAVKHPSNSMRPLDNFPRETRKPDYAVEVARRRRLPVPTRSQVFAFNLFPKSALEGFGKYSIEKLSWCKIRSHNSDVLICATVPAEPTARGHSFYTTTP